MMKQKDIATLLLIAGISAVISFVLSNQFITAGNNKQQSEVVEVISAEFSRPPTEYFNENAVNPTQIIQIGPNENTEPFRTQ